MITVNEFMDEESGQGMVEYGLILVLVSVVTVVVLQSIGSGYVKTMFETVADLVPKIN
ncbi:Flp family type IVb pilin [Erysipelothrix rhusiopathiae]|uniref:Flp family type IVb pilin n=1 Tax=Erysipelothrix piscisicarius TaxID=2485784 RepID=A0A3Q8S7P4_9FIRM|nr:MULTISPECIES: Flp family type IVb pilin [Erysipelothrix]AZK44357.1 Flp family type IVb pilin [Erysipelothrix piscisicarius]MBK2403335.1 Flp family type IVb pilin [Erysipelothrix sp. strain 2 (EsS2-7-Brazil)]NBA00697.1 Flp family type IVb pilin [Erysipelothrix rhusiopathiae]